MYILDNPVPEIKLDAVLHAMNCSPDSPVHDTMIEEFYCIYKEALSLLQPFGALDFGTLTEFTKTSKYPAGSKVLYAVLSVGDKIKQRSSQAFQNGDYVHGMMFDVIADCALFSLESALLEKLNEICTEHKIGITARLEAPHDIPMEVQKEAWIQLDLKNKFGIDLSSGYMFDPVKTSCQVFVITEDTTQFKVNHDCRNCSNTNCKFRNIPPVEIQVKKGNIIKTLLLAENESLLDGLIREGYYISAVCGGKGRCGKCKVRILSPDAPVSPEDEKFFSQQELSDGWRLSCTLYPKNDMSVSFELNDEADFEVVSDYDVLKVTDHNNDTKKPDEYYDIAIDIGTTTIAFQLLNKANGEVCHTTARINKQRQYGADVISRIQASVDGKGAELRESIRADLKSGILLLCQEYGITIHRIARIAIAANTTMTHLLMGYDCTTLGQYPFTPVNINFITGNIENIIGISAEAEVIILPGISTYVGGDIVSGLYACDFDKTDDICLLVDLGTNGEMALGNRKKIIVTSTAAGPAFEGGNISCGTGSVDGAICSVKLDGSNVKIQTIRKKAPVGICGTGVVELTAEMLKENLIDETGLLDEDYFDEGFPIAQSADNYNIVFTQKDIRELQLAKAAIRAGAETLICRYGISKDQISKVYIAGGFGYRLDTEKAIAIGMLPREFAGCTKAVGNSALAGVVKFLQNTDGKVVLENLIKSSEEINLSMDKDFNDFYMESMMF